jgi:branched-chain amino acid transport system permease protein
VSRATLFGWKAPDRVRITCSGRDGEHRLRAHRPRARVLRFATRPVVAGVRDNELRVEYLGTSVANIVAWNYVIAAGLGGVGGALAVLALGHIDPNFSYWTTSGEFVFVAILAGHHSVVAMLASSCSWNWCAPSPAPTSPTLADSPWDCFLLLVIRFLPTDSARC